MYKILLNEKDFLEYQLYTASKSKRIKKKRIIVWISTTFFFLILGFLFHESNNIFLRNYFLIAGLISLVLFPFYQRWKYKKHYLKHIRENHKNKFGIESNVEFNKDFLMTSDQNSEGKIKMSEIEQINEISGHIFIKTKTGESLIIPKEKIQVEKFIQDLSSITNELNINWNKELGWKWK